MQEFQSRRRIHGGDKTRLDTYRNQLNADIDRLYDSYVLQNSAKVYVT